MPTSTTVAIALVLEAAFIVLVMVLSYATVGSI